jgi:hypothetical protein
MREVGVERDVMEKRMPLLCRYVNIFAYLYDMIRLNYDQDPHLPISTIPQRCSVLSAIARRLDIYKFQISIDV